MISLAIINALMLSYVNRRKKEKRSEILAPFITEKEPDGGVAAWVELGDRHPDFRYVIWGNFLVKGFGERFLRNGVVSTA